MTKPMKIQPQVIDDAVSGLKLTFTDSHITVESAAIPHMNRQFFFNEDGTLDGTGTAMAGARGDRTVTADRPHLDRQVDRKRNR